MKTFKQLLSQTVRKTLKRFGYVPERAYVKLLATTREEEIVRQVRGTLEVARDWYALRGRRILSVDCENYLGAFEEAMKFDRLDVMKFDRLAGTKPSSN